MIRMAHLEDIGEKANYYNPQIAATLDYAVEQKLHKLSISADKQYAKQPCAYPCLHLW